MHDERRLLEQIELGEDSGLEFKEMRFTAAGRVSAPARNDLADGLAALANGRGGTMLLGVSDQREILGIPLEHLDAVEGFVREVCQDSINPPLAPDIRKVRLPNGLGERVAVIAVEVTRSLFVHRSPGGYLHRVGSSKRQMAPDFLARLQQQRSTARLIWFDEQVVPDATLHELDDSLWRRFAATRTTEAREAILVKLGLARRSEDDGVRPTVAGVLMATRDPRRWLPNAYIQAVAYRGSTVVPEIGGSAYQLDASDISGPLDEQVGEALRFVARNMRTGASKDVGRRDIPQFDLAVVFEAIVNAVAHRDYSIHSAKIRLRLFEDRLELYSPGGLSNTMTVDSLQYRQFTRNETIASLLARCPVPGDLPGLAGGRTTMMDKRGEGVPIILERGAALAGRTPEYRLIDDQELLLVIHGAPIGGTE